jgi:4a-hydroxytetrahydrobiopterin dehydratase
MWPWTHQPHGRQTEDTIVTMRRRFGHKPATTPGGGVAMRALWNAGHNRDYLSDALALLTGWTHEGRELKRVLRLDDAQHAALAERIQVVADALQLRPDVRRLDGHTQIRLAGSEVGGLTAGEVTLAARIEDAYRAITRAA